MREARTFSGSILQFEFGNFDGVGDESGEERGNGGGNEDLSLSSVRIFHVLDYLSLLQINSSSSFQQILEMYPNQNQNGYQPPNPYADNYTAQPYPPPTNYPNQNYPNTYDQTYNQNLDKPPSNQNTLNVEIIKAPERDPLQHLDDSFAGRARKQFIMKVYMILGIQFLITAGMCFASYYSLNFLLFQIENYWLMWTCVGLLLTTEIIIFCCPAGRQHPINLIMLLIFTLCESYIVSYICAIVANENGSQVVVVAAVMTLAIVLALTAYAIFTPTDFTIKWGIVIVILMAMLMLGIFSIFVWSPFLNNLYCSLGVIVFGIYLVIDTQLIIGGRRLEITMDDYVVGALILYIDIIQIFLYLLALLGKK